MDRGDGAAPAGGVSASKRVVLGDRHASIVFYSFSTREYFIFHYINGFGNVDEFMFRATVGVEYNVKAWRREKPFSPPYRGTPRLKTNVHDLSVRV